MNRRWHTKSTNLLAIFFYQNIWIFARKLFVIPYWTEKSWHPKSYVQICWFLWQRLLIFFQRLLDKCEEKDKKDSIEKVRNFCNDLMSKETIKEKPPIYLLATLVDINKEKNQEEAIKVSKVGFMFHTGAENYFFRMVCFIRHFIRLRITKLFWFRLF